MKIQSKINNSFSGFLISNLTISSARIDADSFVFTQRPRLMDLNSYSTNFIAEMESLKQRVECLERMLVKIDE